MDYEKKYRDLVEAVKELQEANPSDEGIQKWVEDNVPELAESENERIRNEIVRFIQMEVEDEIVGNKWIAWLEKQGKPGARYKYVEELLEADAIYQMAMNDAMVEEAKNKAIGALSNLEISKLLGLEKEGKQMPADKVEPKFKNGQWIVWQDECYKVNYNGCEYELVDSLSILLDYGTIDENAHLWDVAKDAKNGDVLVASDGSIFIFGGVDDSACKYYAALPADNYIKINKEAKGGYWETSRAVYPATKEQRDILMKAMADAGYEWDVEKKESKKIERKSTEWYEKTKGLDEVEIYILSIAPNRPLDAVKVDSKNIRFLINKEQKLWSEEDKDRYAWKPSDEQIVAFEHFVRNVMGSSYASFYKRKTNVLCSLLNDLKKL